MDHGPALCQTGECGTLSGLGVGNLLHHHKPLAKVDRYDVPYRVLYSRNIDNLFIGGRNMSVTHQALGTVRVQMTLGMAGEVTGMAAQICKKHGVYPRAVYEMYLPELKKMMKRGAPLR